MLRKTSDLVNFKLGALDGEIGHLRDFYFDDQSWTVRYLVADTGNWLHGRQVLLSPCSVKSVEESERIVRFDLSVKQIEETPSIDTDKPVTRQHELEYAQYYGWPMYWYGPALWGPVPYPILDRKTVESAGVKAPPEQTANPHLRSVDEVTGYHIHTRDGEIGHVEDFVVDAYDWAIRYVVVDTRNWWPGKRVLVSPTWIERISWEEAAAHVDLDRETIREAPGFDPSSPITRPYEASLFEYYGREAYWSREHKAAA